MSLRMQLQRSLSPANTLHRKQSNGSYFRSQTRVSKSVRIHATNNNNTEAAAIDLSATKQKLKEACLTKATPPDQVLQYLAEVETVSKTSSQVKGTFLESNFYCLTLLLPPSSSASSKFLSSSNSLFQIFPIF
jgi:hypothetical protein